MKIKKMITALIVATLLFGILGTTVMFASPGDSDDPVITLSYLNDVFMAKINSLVKNKTTFEVVNISAGEKLIGKSGTEFILRMGSGTAIATAKGGIADTTAAIDLKDGEKIPSNSLLIVPMDDGRGFTAQTDAILLVKGEYTIK